ncbi:FecR family protein [Confluentibacter sediminis]|uniref:FecR family protein n=1 Tax=Confluentibacter sediminis TaxID=2219045 RepID=UPI000DAF4018|nr:FecR family protein [Confluentibacter sediminis]
MQQKQIDHLILKFIHQSLSHQDMDMLDLWLRDKQNQAYFKAFLETHHLINMDTPFIGDFDQIKARLNSNPKRTPLSWLRYAAAAILIIGMIVGGYLYKDRWLDTQVKDLPVVINNQIIPGGNKAILTLETGEFIALESGMVYENQRATSNGEEIVYQTGEVTKGEIAYNTLTIPRGGQFAMVLSDGTRVWLNSESQLKYPVNFVEGQSREVELIYGEAYFDVSPSMEHNGSDFKVVSNNQTIQVLGTEFNVKAYKDEPLIYTTLAEGKIGLKYGNHTQNLKPGEQSVLDKSTQNIEIRNVNIKVATAWREGIFNFIDGKSLKEIMKTLSRWYDFEVVFEKKSLEEVRFKGILGKSQSIEEILSAIKSTSINNYEIYEKTIYLK